MADDWDNYVKDARTVCKYGVKCYQKNPEHHRKFKHPPLTKRKQDFKQNEDKKRFKPSPKPKEVEPEDEGVATEKMEDKVKENTVLNASVISTEYPEVSTKVEPEPSPLIDIPENVTYHDKSDHTKLKDLFLLEMPKDFFKLFECLEAEGNLEKILASVNLELIGPYDLLLGRLPVLDDKDLYLIHWRFFYDPPEFQSVLKKKGKSEYHIGYFRDSPEEMPVFLASNDSSKDCRLTPMADNIFGAIYLYLEKEKKSSPFVQVACQKLMEKVKSWAESHSYSLAEYDMKRRLGKAVTKSFHGAGIVVPYNKKTQLGYRKLVESDANIRKLFTKLGAASSESEKNKVKSELQPVITFASIAVDECDFGTGVEAGINLFCSGLKELESSALSSLSAVYPLLQRDAFSKIIQVHLKYRRKGPNMSILSANNK